jgi:hypothetical protein
MSQQPTIEWTRPMLERFKKEYQRARKDKQDVFRFEGNEYFIEYARYLIQFLETKLIEMDINDN